MPQIRCRRCRKRLGGFFEPAIWQTDVEGSSWCSGECKLSFPAEESARTRTAEAESRLVTTEDDYAVVVGFARVTSAEVAADGAVPVSVAPESELEGEIDAIMAGLELDQEPFDRTSTTTSVDSDGDEYSTPRDPEPEPAAPEAAAEAEAAGGAAEINLEQGGELAELKQRSAFDKPDYRDAEKMLALARERGEQAAAVAEATRELSEQATLMAQKAASLNK